MMCAAEAPEERSRLRDVFAVAEFRALFMAQTQSRIGDQLARVALALLVFSRTSSAVLTALMYAMTYLPPLLTAPLLAGLADRHSRRTVMVVVDLVRAVLVGLMAVPGMPLGAVIVLLIAMTVPQPLFSAARNAALATVLPGDRLAVGMGAVNATDNIAQIAGFTLGGVLVGLLGGSHVALAVDAASFAASAAWIRWGVTAHIPAAAPAGSDRRGIRFTLGGLTLLRRDRRLAGLALLTWLFGFFLAPEALAAPYAHQVGAPPVVVGVLMAADLVGSAVGMLLVTRLPAAARQRLLIPLAIGTGLPLAASAALPTVPAALVLWACSGAMAGYLVLAQVRFTQAVPDDLRARAIAVASAGLQTAQGLGVLIAGAFAEVVPPSAAVGICGALGSLGAAVVGLAARPTADRPRDPTRPERRRGPAHGGDDGAARVEEGQNAVGLLEE
jgi:MFS family permease